MKVIEQEKEWAKYLFRDGSMIGLNEQILCQYIEWIGSKRMRAVGLTSPYSVPKVNPLPWTEKWIGGGNVQVAPQETEITSYVTGGVKQDVDKNGSIGPNYKPAKLNQFGDVAYYDENNKVYILKDNNPNNEYLVINKNS